MHRSAWWVVLAVVLVAGLVAAGVVSARSFELEQGIVGAGDSQRDVAQTIWFQGFLADADTGDPLDGDYNMVARIFAVPSGGAALWGPETHYNVGVTNGWFNIELGAVIGGLPDFATPPYYAELTVEGESLMPRLKLGSVPTALRSGATDEGGGTGYWTETEWGIAYAETVAIGVVDDPWGMLTVSPSGPGGAAIQHFAPLPLVPPEGAGGTKDYNGTIMGLFPWEDDFFLVNIEEEGSLWFGAGDYPTCALTESTKFVISPYWFGGGPGPRGGYLPGALTVDVGGAGDYGAAIYSNHDYEGAHVVHAEYYGDAPSAVAVYGDATSNDNWGIGGEFHGSGFGLAAIAEGSGIGGDLLGVLAVADNGMDQSDYAYSVYGVDPGGGPRAIESYSGYFEGDVYVGGVLDYPIAASKIDHPLDPANMTLSHASVESPEMMNVYNGNVVLDGAGEATVVLPDYFEALNADFRYQLTCIGGFAPVYVAEEISGNSFRIAGGEAGMKVSWMVTGIRNDAFARENEFVVEEAKVGRAVGRYLQPEAHGLSATMGVEYREELEAARAAAAARNAEASARVAAQREQAKAAGGTDSWWKQ